MSDPQQPPPKPKAMSSRLLTMKFMQRAAGTQGRASTSTSNSPTTPTPTSFSSSPGLKLQAAGLQANNWHSQAGDSSAPSSSKRPRLSGQLGDSDDFSASSLAEVRAPEGETRWCFAVREGGATRAQDQDGMRVEVLSGRLAGEDESGAVWRTEEGVGRQVFGGEKRKNKPAKKQKAKKVVAEPAKKDDGETDESNDSDNSEDSFDRKAQEILKTSYEEPQTRTRDIDQRPYRISGAVQNLDRTQCHSCGGFGHLRRDCPNQGMQRRHQPIGNRQKG